MTQCGSSRLAKGNVNCPLHHTQHQFRQHLFYFYIGAAGGGGGSSQAAAASSSRAAEPERLAGIRQRFSMAQLASMPADSWYAWHAFSGDGQLQLRMKRLVRGPALGGARGGGAADEQEMEG